MYANLGSTQSEIKIFRVPGYIDLDELSEDAKKHTSSILTMFHNIVKRALKNKKYQQIGKFPKFFLTEDKIEIRQF